MKASQLVQKLVTTMSQGGNFDVEICDRHSGDILCIETTSFDEDTCRMLLEIDVGWPVEVGPAPAKTADHRYHTGQVVTVALETPGPGTRERCFLREVEGTITGGVAVGSAGELVLRCPVTEENLEDWQALMPDQPPQVGEELWPIEVEPDWIVQ